ncbi:MAG: hypothetical protein OXB98_23165 [Bryobacterales bacterium]|nr:hypothetical protein [Bryobacterales bacterium]
MSEAATGGGRPAAVFPHRHEGDGIMTAAMAMPRNTADMFLVHFFGTGLADDQYVVERIRVLSDGDIPPIRPEAAGAKGRGKAKRTVVSRKQAEAMRPNRTEIIVCTGLKTRGGVQTWVRWPRGSSGS